MTEEEFYENFERGAALAAFQFQKNLCVSLVSKGLFSQEEIRDLLSGTLQNIAQLSQRYGGAPSSEMAWKLAYHHIDQWREHLLFPG